ncbi:TIGR03668 family PPOX class F420-dependent oxidoreductase [Streptomyces sp. NPDC051569]|uniref:TIGR03668 family PPOX class F420-dependent oxidoreductase n=1 Tax=Streptomyces sp. NPDC051569 TaxID=3365661 RepID=UPI0037BB3C1D
MELGPESARARFEGAAVGRLATVDGAGVPHLVPVTFVVDEDRLYFAVDHKPKSTWDLRRLRNIRENGRVAVLVDHYGDDWSTLWWARADGWAEVWEDPVRREGPVSLLQAKYPQYRETVPAGPVVAIRVERWSGWSFAAVAG